LLLGVDGDNFVYRHRTRAVAWGLVGPKIRVAGAFRGLASSDPLSIVVRQASSGHCVRVNTIEHLILAILQVSAGHCCSVDGLSLPGTNRV
jgi:hypothetical protein